MFYVLCDFAGNTPGMLCMSYSDYGSAKHKYMRAFAKKCGEKRAVMCEIPGK
jgi:hypothetical protein